tara:strand:- start:1944 stop:3515 length:1572 start_codon:yes stop_codon:yes gene_type:complete
MEHKNKNINISQNDDEIDLIEFFKSIKRESKLIFSVTASFTLISIIHSFIAKPIYRGTFDIVANQSNKTDSKTGNILSMTNSSFFKTSVNEQKTQEYILKSPSVLMPIFNYVKEYSADKGVNTENMSYKEWLNNNLDIRFKKNTNILTIGFINEDKEFIIDVLNRISEKYKDYSKLERDKNINNSIEYLESQKIILKKRAESSLKELNEFSITNGLGDIDGFIELENTEILTFNEPKIVKNKNTLSKLSKKSADNKSTGGQRFRRQFSLLEKYESSYIDLSSKLKPNSETLNSLKVKIDNLRDSLKRPNEILIKFRELRKISARNELFLNQIETELGIKKLEKVKKKDPWEMISNPTIDKDLVAPKRSANIFFTFIISLFLAIIIAKIKESKSGIFYNKESIDTLLKCNYLETINTDNKTLNTKLIEKIQLNLNKKNQLNIGFIGEINKNKDYSKDRLFYKNENEKSLKIIDLIDFEAIKECDNIIIVLESGKCSINDIQLLNKLIFIYPDKFVGWLFLDKTN